MSEFRNQFGAAVRDLRRQKGLTLRKVAKAALMSVVYLSDIERGERSSPDDWRARKIAEAVSSDSDEQERLCCLAFTDRLVVRLRLGDLPDDVRVAMYRISVMLDEPDINLRLCEGIKQLAAGVRPCARER